jgi:hypothetical protein
MDRPFGRRKGRFSEPPAASIEQQVKNHNEQNQADSTTAVVPKAGSHVGAAASEHQQKDNQNQNEWHAPECSTRR